MSEFEIFLTNCEEVALFEENLKELDGKSHNEMSIEAERQEIHDLWEHWKKSYKDCIADPECDWKEKVKGPTSASTATKSSSSIAVPPCDTEMFHGDYTSWPGFRDLFTAVYINNKKLSPVEKLYHLFQRTTGEAREINRNVPLTADGFTIAWENLKSQYENERLLINSQLKILFILAPCTQESATGIKRLQRDINNCISILELYGTDVKSWNAIFVYQCSLKLPRLTLALWEQSLQNKTKTPRWEDLNNFLSDRFHALESVSDVAGSSGANNSQAHRQKYNNFEKPRQFKVHHTKVSDNKCPMCKGTHNLKSCPKFLNIDFKNRLAFIKRERRCINCLAPGHMSAECRNNSCSKCGLKHHILLHKHTMAQGAINGPSANQSSSQSYQNQNLQSTEVPSTSGNVRTYHTSVSTKTLLATAWVNIIKDGVNYKTRALIDPCSDDTFVSAKIQKLLKLPTKPITADIVGLGGEHLTKCSKMAVFTIGSNKNPSFTVDTDAFVVADVTGNTPTHTLDSSLLQNMPNIELADSTFYQSGPVDILLGGNLYPLILLNGVKHGILGSLVAQETVFGWILTGPTKTLSPRKLVRMTHCTRVSIETQLSKFWEIEEVPHRKKVSDDDLVCEEIYTSTTKRNSDGRYMVDLPFKSGLQISKALGPSRYIALSQFLRNEKSLSQKSELKELYDSVISEYLSLGHMEKIDSKSFEQDNVYYMPHHGVFKPESTTTKLRVVFNASCPTANGKSLNDLLYVGPVLQKDIISLVLNWRFYKFVFNADISKMYRQILVNPQHANYQRILFRPSQEDDIEDFRMKTVTFGVNCAPYLALRTLLQLAEDEKQNFPIGSQILKDNMYVDDALVGSHTILAGLKARDELISILSSAKFDLRKWTANDKSLLKGIPREHLLREDFLEFDDKSSAKTLGIRWNASVDSFYFVTEKIQNKTTFTKREVLSVIARLFDPLGWLSPVIVSANILMQQLWLDDIGWDDQLKPSTLIKWKSFIANYSEIDNIKIPRWVKYSPNCTFEVHGFCDSSELAYSAALYLRVEIENNIFTSLLVSKSKVAPIKKVSLPRLELCGALLLSNVVDSVLPQLKIPKPKLMVWSDSTIVIAWLKKPSNNWTTFVANRVSIIQERIGSDWHHVSTYDNPADLATRGLTPLELKESSLWWFGPPWLSKSLNSWPLNSSVPETTLETKPVRVHVARSAIKEDVLERFSCLNRAIHVVAYIFRFFCRAHPKLKHDAKYETQNLSASELKFVRYRLMSLAQKIHFPIDYARLAANDKLETGSSLLTMTPFLDKEGLIRANGRLGSTSSLSYNERHPIILAYNSRFAWLYIKFIHEMTHHGGNQLTLATVRLECWIIRAKTLIKKCINNCKKCVIARKKLLGQVMASLPDTRTTFSRSFTYTGVDFAGPFDFKTFTGRGCRTTKGYICLFVCFSTKAIHLEPVSDLSTAAFLAALTRFVSRRGCPLCIYSDNGKNFVGASKELKADFVNVISKLKDESLAKYGQQKLEWHFIPAAAPHMGGLWEAGVKSCKTHLKKMSGQVRHTFEEFATILGSIEACLNSRPLSPMSNDVEDLVALTPGHFLIGSSLLAPAQPEEMPSKTALLNRWRRTKVTQQEFCKRWKAEYLKELHKRNKWKSPQDDLRLNDLVVLRNEGICSQDWRLARVVKLHYGKDDRVRVVELRTQTGNITRPVHKLVLLPRLDH